MELLEGLETRRSLRAFKNIAVSRETIARVLQAAARSPSYSNTQPWEVAVVSGGKKEELSRLFCELLKSKTTPNPDIPLPPGWPPEMEQRTREHGARRFQALGIERGNPQQREELRLANMRFWGAPCVLFLLMERTLNAWSVFDMGLFAQSLLLAAHSLGLGSCLQASAVHYPDTIRQVLGLPATKQLVVGIALGYPDHEARINSYHSTRISPDSFTQWYS